MNLLPTALPGVVILEPKLFRDERGYFFESWHRDRYREAGLPGSFVQDNLSFSVRNVLRGLHYQYPKAQGKLVSVVAGSVFDVAADIRRGSPTFGQWTGTILSSDNARQMYIPPGFAHGFLVLSDTAVFLYKCTDFYQPGGEGSIRWDDPDLNIDWPLKDLSGSPTLSTKDAAAPPLAAVPDQRLPRYEDYP
jgi:dTDP-4-dehydrorhamnose 3,5-epimerase